MRATAPSAFIFDLDGTLIDSRPGIEASICEAARLHGVAIAPAAIRREIGPPIREILERLLPGVGHELLAQITAGYRKAYDSGGCLSAALFSGVEELLQRLNARQARCFVVTNKPAIPTNALLSHLRLEEYFAGVITPDHPTSPFTAKPDAVAALLDSKGIDSAEAWVIGDAIDDARAAAVNGVPFIAAAYGYGDANKQTTYPIAHVIHQPLGLLEHLEERETPSSTAL